MIPGDLELRELGAGGRGVKERYLMKRTVSVGGRSGTGLRQGGTEVIWHLFEEEVRLAVLRA